MDSVIRGLVVYCVLLVIFRIAGKRSLAQITTFDFILLLIISESIQQAMIDADNSITNAFLIVTTLVAIDIGLSVVTQRSSRFKKLLDDVPMILVENGVVLRDRLQLSRVAEADILHAARELQGLERLEQVKYAVLERNGEITIVPKQA
jgi:uncharacterized membrane protein YcaP (DUF421 family)